METDNRVKNNVIFFLSVTVKIAQRKIFWQVQSRSVIISQSVISD